MDLDADKDKGVDKGETKGGEGGDDPNSKSKGADDKKDDKESSMTDNEAKLLKELMEKKKRAEKAEKDLADIQKQLESYGGTESIEKLLKDKKDAATREMEARGEWDRLKAQMIEEHQKEKESLAEQVQATKSNEEALRATIAELTVGTAFAQSAFIREELALTPAKARIVYGGHFEHTESGNIVGYDKPAGTSSRTQLIDGKGDPLGFDAAMRKIIEADPDKDALLRSKAAKGARSNTAGKTTPTETQSTLKGKDRIVAGLSLMSLQD